MSRRSEHSADLGSEHDVAADLHSPGHECFRAIQQPRDEAQILGQTQLQHNAGVVWLTTLGFDLTTLDLYATRVGRVVGGNLISDDAVLSRIGIKGVGHADHGLVQDGFDASGSLVYESDNF